jgi:hypothetical protein
MKRRAFITLLGGAAAWPLGARAQQGGMPTIGLLWPADAPPVFPRMESFRQGLRASGLVEGQNVAIELRYAQRGPQQLPELAGELVRSKVDADVWMASLRSFRVGGARSAARTAASWATLRAITRDCGPPPSDT